MLGPLLANVVLVVLVREGGAAASCGPLVGFLQRDGRWEAVLAVTAPHTFVPGDDFNLQVTMAVHEKLEGLDITLELSESASEVEAKLRTGGSLTYRVRFPVPDSAPIPRVTAITVNGAPVCREKWDKIDGSHLIISNTLQGKRIPRSPVLDQEDVAGWCGRRAAGGDDGCLEDGAFLLHKEARRWPWLAAVTSGQSVVGGGSLVSLRHVLTSARSVFYPPLHDPGNIGRPTDPLEFFTVEDLTVILGATAIARNYKENENVQSFKVSEVLVHSGYEFRSLVHNVALLVLASPATVTPSVRPVCAWPAQPTRLPASGVVLNWDSNTNASYVQKVPVVDTEECSLCNILIDSENNYTICAGHRNGVGFCVYGNDAVKGSGLYTPEIKLDGSTRWFLRGVYGSQTAFKHLKFKNYLSCRFDWYNVYTDITKYAMLIYSTISQIPNAGVVDPPPSFLSAPPDASLHRFISPGELLNKNQSSTPQLQNLATCGQSTFDDSTRCPDTLSPVASSAEWPWLVALVSLEPEGEEYTIVGSGTLVTTSHVITVASIFYSHGKCKCEALSDELDYYEARFGTRNLNTFEQDLIMQTRKLKTVVKHPDWAIKEKSTANDVAVLVLESPVLVTPHVRPACAWGEATQLVPGTPGYVVGWDSDSKFPRLFDVPTYDLEHCLNIQNWLKYYENQNFTFCAGKGNGLSLCRGGEGAGLFVPERTPGGAIRWVLRGLVARDENMEGCSNAGSFFVLHDVQHFKHWIHSVIHANEQWRRHGGHYRYKHG